MHIFDNCSFFLNNLLGKYNEDTQKKKEMIEAEENKISDNMVVNSRCKVTLQNTSPRLGTVMYIGPVEGLTGNWIGVQYDEPLGKNDGS